eukprot:m.123968 g.123968  ORF g.123968 m.123968 type:complete len:473 (+) comp16610_c1_seq2:588-2006(+)
MSRLAACEDELERVRGQATAWRLQIDDLQAELDSTRSVFGQRTEDLARCQAELDKLERVQRERDRVEDEARSLRARIEELRRDKESLLTDTDVLRQQLELSELEREALEKQIRTVIGEKAQLQEAFDNMQKSFSKDLAGAEERLASLEREKGDLVREVRHMSTVRDDHQTSLTRLVSKLEALEGKLAAKDQDTEHLRKRVRELESENSVLQGQLSAASADAQRISRQLGASEGDREILKGQLAAVRNADSQREHIQAEERESLQRKLATALSDRDQARMDLRSAAGERDSLLRKFDQLQADHDTLLKRYNQIAADKDQVQRDLNIALDEFKLSATAGSHDRQQHERDAVRLRKKEDQLRSVNEQLAVLARDNDALAAKLRVSERTNTELEDALAKARHSRSTSRKFEKELDLLRRELDQKEQLLQDVKLRLRECPGPADRTALQDTLRFLRKTRGLLEEPKACKSSCSRNRR